MDLAGRFLCRLDGYLRAKNAGGHLLEDPILGLVCWANQGRWRSGHITCSVRTIGCEDPVSGRRICLPGALTRRNTIVEEQLDKGLSFELDVRRQLVFDASLGPVYAGPFFADIRCLIVTVRARRKDPRRIVRGPSQV